MAELRWTDEQIKAIEASGSNILVSAAAGSGKTAVLVERVIRMLTRSEEPVDLDELLIMTFTNAAASQMKEKIYKAIRKALENDPQNAHLRRQLLKVNNARIYTIDALCLRIVRDNFQDVDIDPGFRIADPAEAGMLMDDVLKELIEAHYSEPTPGFLEFAESYTDKSDYRLEEIITSLYNFSVSHPEPEQWIRESVAPYLVNAPEGSIDPWALEMLGEPDREAPQKWMKDFKDYVYSCAYSIASMAQRVIEISEMNYGPFKYSPVAEDALNMVQEIIGEESPFDRIRDCLRKFLDDWGRLPTITKKDDVDPALKNQANNLLKEIKNIISELSERFFRFDYIESSENMGRCANVAASIAALTLEFGQVFAEAKKERKIAEFNDVAHFALNVLIKHDDNGRMLKDENGYIFSETADRMAAGLKEIIIDEYQDTNQLQEWIATALSGERFGRPDIFMVGDVKQSIYGFRMACPELFISKSDLYEEEIGGERIILGNNFRSRRQVLDLTNYIFNQVMIPEVGGIDYTDGNRLEFGAKTLYSEPEGEEIYAPELIFISGTGEDAKKAESYQIALKIEQMVGNFPVTCEDGSFRPAEYGDICILTRNSANPEIEQMLKSRGIPFVRSASKGFFGSLEVRLTLNLLEIIDNPFQDIPFTAVLTSPVVGLKAGDLARIKTSYEKAPFSMFDACREYAKELDLPALSEFLEKLEDYRQRATYMNIPEFLEYVLAGSALMDILTAMPQGESRRANIDFLIAKASDFSESSYSGLFNFLRYIRSLEKSDIDFGSATGSASNANAVKMMTMHKSKGLEFPIVIIARTGGKYSNNDFTGSILMDRNLGLGIELRNPEERTIESTLPMETIRVMRLRQLIAEEMRVLYVALTRAKDKLVITGSDAFPKTWAGQLELLKADINEQLDERAVVADKSFLRLILRALIRHRDAGAVSDFLEIPRDERNPLYNGDCRFRCVIKDTEDAFEERAVEMLDAVRLDSELKAELTERVAAVEGSGEAAENIFAYEYPYSWASKTRVKITASQLEKKKDDKTWKRYIPDYSKDDGEEQERLYGAERGTAYHNFFEMLDLKAFTEEMSDAEKLEIIERQLEAAVSSGRMKAVAAASVEPAHILTFINSETGKQMRRAELVGRLRREQQFVMGRPENGEERLLQGIIDAFIVEDDGIILIDYKTDRGKTREDFIESYKAQQDAYKDALEAAFGRPVKAELLFIVETGEAIDLL